MLSHWFANHADLSCLITGSSRASIGSNHAHAVTIVAFGTYDMITRTLCGPCSSIPGSMVLSSIMATPAGNRTLRSSVYVAPSARVDRGEHPN